MREGAQGQDESAGADRHAYEQAMLGIRSDFEANLRNLGAGAAAVAARSRAVDRLVRGLWDSVRESTQLRKAGVSLIAVGGYGREELFLSSDVDLMFLLDARRSERELKDPIRQLNQHLWDGGLRLSPMTRTLIECERFNVENVEFTLALLDARLVCGDEALFARMTERSLPKMMGRERKRIVQRLASVTRLRHHKYGNTLFHLEPNIKDCPGGLRDAHVCAWLEKLEAAKDGETKEEFRKARDFLLLVRTFLHLRHRRDDNTLDWHVQDEAAAASLGFRERTRVELDAAYWMRLYFRHARVIERAVGQALEGAAPGKQDSRFKRFAALRRLSAKADEPGSSDYEVSQGRIVLGAVKPLGDDPAHDPETMFAVFAEVAKTGMQLSPQTEQRLEGALPYLSTHLEDGPGLWRQMETILILPHAGLALRTMHAIGVLELVLPEFHGIDALVIRDAYHRYTVDEHTFVLVDTLHGLLTGTGEGESWEVRFGQILRDLPHPGLLFLAALLHDTGKGHNAAVHAAESVKMAENVVKRLELDSYESELVLGLIRNHLEMSNALRRDVFATETIQALAGRVLAPEALKMLTVFTYADISAVHPDALTPWKAENLHHLYVATAHYLDRNLDDDRIGLAGERNDAEVLERLLALLPGQKAALGQFLEGFPQRYLVTRKKEEIRRHFEMAVRLASCRSEEEEPALPAGEVQLDFLYQPGAHELTLVSRDRPILFATMAGALAAWGMNIVTANAFSNAQRVVVDSFRFTDSFKTLELNTSERVRFIASIKEAMTGTVPVEVMLAGRRRARKKTPKVTIETRIQFDDSASSRSTVIEIVAQDTPGLLRALTLTLAARGCNIEVALVDTEGDMAIDVFYVTRSATKLPENMQESMRRTLVEAIEANAR